MFNYLVKSGAAEQEVESFITNVNSGYIPPGKAIELVNQIYDVSKSESVSPDQLPNYIKQKLEEKQKIDEEIQQADVALQSKNISVEAINEHLKLSEELDKHGLSTNDIESFITNVNSGYIPLQKTVELVNQIYEISKSESIPPDQLPIISNKN